MFKKLSIIILLLLLLTGCNKTNQNDGKIRIRLEEKYYNKGEYIDITGDELSKLDKENYILFLHNNYCSLAFPCNKIFQEFMKKYNIDFLSIKFDEFKKTKYYKVVEFAPSVLIINKGNVVAFLDANSDEDLEKYQDSKVFEEWLNNYVYFTK